MHAARSARRAAAAQELERYAEAHSSSEDLMLAAVAEETHAFSNDDYMMVGAAQGHLLAMLVHIMCPGLVLEIGTFTGYGTLAMARALPPEGRIVSCEIDARHAAIANRHIAASPYAKQVSVEVGPAMATIEKMNGPFDLVFVDADKTGYLDYYEAVLPKLSPHGLIVVDNTLHMGLVAPERAYAKTVDAVRRFNSIVSADPQVEQVILPLFDGLTLIRPVDNPLNSQVGPVRS